MQWIIALILVLGAAAIYRYWDTILISAIAGTFASTVSVEYKGIAEDVTRLERREIGLADSAIRATPALLCPFRGQLGAGFL